MSFVIGVLLSLAGVLFGILLWRNLPIDRIGRPTRVRRQATGFQGQLTEWLYWDAPLGPPKLKDITAAGDGNISHVGNRALGAIVRRTAIQRNVKIEEAHALLLKEQKRPWIRAFLEGKMKRAIRLHWQTRYNGPEFLFYPWYYGVAVIRHGKRHLYLETLSAILEELQRT